MGNLSKEIETEKNQMEMLGLQLATSEVKKIHNIGSTADQSCMAEEEVSVLETKLIEMIQSEEQREKKGKK